VRLVEIRRCPVKSMQGELPAEAALGTMGLVGDRAYGLVDLETGAVASAKDPRRWSSLLAVSARYPGEPGPDQPVTITLPGGADVSSADADIDERLSEAAGRRVALRSTPPEGAAYDEVWPLVVGLAPDELVASMQTGETDDGEPVSRNPVGMFAAGTFQDLAPVTLLTTASLRAAKQLHPAGDWDPARFRMTMLIDVDDEGFVENGWVGRTVRVGPVRLSVFGPTPRCVMTTLAQPGLPADREVLKTLARHNREEYAGIGRFACLGVYANVDRVGTVAVGDAVEVS